LKALITEPTHVIEEKFQNPLEVKNLVNVIMATNEAWAVPAGDHERRFFVLDVSDRRMQDRGYFRQLTEQMEDGGVEAMLHDLLNREIKHDIGEAPRTAALADQVRLTLGSVEAFWLDCLNGGEFFGSGNGEGWPSSIPKGGDGGLYDSSYLEYCRARRLRKTVTRLSFGKRLKKICPDIGSKRASKAPRREEYKLPPLEECRKAFSRAMGMPYSWADSEQEDVTNVSDAVSDEET